MAWLAALCWPSTDEPMSDLIQFTVFDSDGNIARDGSCSIDDVLLQPNYDLGENVLEGKAPDRLAYKVIIPDKEAPYLRERSQEDADAQRAKFTFYPAASPVDVVVELLKAKGIAVSDAEVAAAQAAAAQP